MPLALFVRSGMRADVKVPHSVVQTDLGAASLSAMQIVYDPYCTLSRARAWIAFLLFAEEVEASGQQSASY